ncbi:hypothetical protein [Qipengyuania flava]|uniref:hypothetical protein n=1 Tax=Qipengyuania flava TaxID=192812 RepID=UPI001C62BA0A|nr:hypothetical protein [Qipengyuania flava]QYJ05940.1 hypothetical protein KUV82_07465 [Qipengyuania flava]
MMPQEPISTREFIAHQRNATNVFMVLFAIILAGFWVYGLADYLLDLGWGSDPNVLWAAPAMLSCGLVVRFVSLKFFGFIENNY